MLQLNQMVLVTALLAVWLGGCDGEGDTAIQQPLNPCGGVEALEYQPGDSCGVCDAGEYVCDESGSVTCLQESDPLNGCGGCAALEFTLGEACGHCDLDLYACVEGDLDAVECSGDTRVNGCAGCTALDLEPGEVCGHCDLDLVICDGEEATTCDGDTRVNVCDGCTALEQEPGAVCGHCDLDLVICDGEEAITCDGDTTVNACGGCEALAIEPGVPCGNCGLDTFVCDGEETTICPFIVNCPPAVSGLAIAPSPVNINEEVVCTYTFVDPDGDLDQSIVDWLVNGVYITSGSPWVADGADGDVVTCRVTPFDGLDSGPVVMTTSVLQYRLLDSNLQLVDLSDLVAPLPLDADGPTQVLWQNQDWEHGSWQNLDWPLAGGDSIGYPALVKNDRGLNPDDHYYLFYAHHDPMSGIGVAVAEDIEGPYIKISPTDSKVLTVPNYDPAGPHIDDPSHYSSPVVVWNQDMAGGDGRWCMYFHYYNHYHSAWESDPAWPGKGYQMTAVAITDDLSSHTWDIYEDPAYGLVSVWDIVPVLMTTDESWSDEASAYHAFQRLVDGTWLAFLRGTNSSTGYTELGFATSVDGLDWTHFPENPVIGLGSPWTLPADVYRPKFIGYLGLDAFGDDSYLVAWAETDGAASIIYSTTTDFVHFQRDVRGYANWGDSQADIVSARREGDVLYLFTGKSFYTMNLPVAP